METKGELLQCSDMEFPFVSCVCVLLTTPQLLHWSHTTTAHYPPAILLWYCPWSYGTVAPYYSAIISCCANRRHTQHRRTLLQRCLFVIFWRRMMLKEKRSLTDLIHRWEESLRPTTQRRYADQMIVKPIKLQCKREKSKIYLIFLFLKYLDLFRD